MPNSPSISLLRNFIDGYKICYCCTTVILMKSQTCRKKKKSYNMGFKNIATSYLLTQWTDA